MAVDKFLFIGLCCDMPPCLPNRKSGWDQRINKRRIPSRMNGVSALATMISVLSFPIIFIVLLYPHVAGARGKWSTVWLFSWVSIGAMLIAALSSPESHLADQEWGWLDWGVMTIGSVLLLFFIVGRFDNLKKIARARNSMERGKSKGIRSPGG